MHALYTGFYESIANLHGHAEFDYSLYGLQYPADVSRDTLQFSFIMGRKWVSYCVVC